MCYIFLPVWVYLVSSYIVNTCTYVYVYCICVVCSKCMYIYILEMSMHSALVNTLCECTYVPACLRHLFCEYTTSLGLLSVNVPLVMTCVCYSFW